MEVMTIGWGYERRWIGRFVIAIANIFIKDNKLQYDNFLGLSNESSAIVSPVITVYTLRKKREIKTVPFVTRLHRSLVPWRDLNWLNGWGMENIFGVDSWDGCTQKYGGEKFLGYRGSVRGDCKDDFVKK